MKEIFTLKTNRDASRNRLVVKTKSIKKYGTDTFKHFGPEIYNCLPNDIGNSEILTSLKYSSKHGLGLVAAVINCLSMNPPSNNSIQISKF